MNADAVITAVNPEWRELYPDAGAGISALAFCDRVHGSCPPQRAALAVAMEAVVTHAEPRFTQDYTAGTLLRRIVVTACPEGGLLCDLALAAGEQSARDSEHLRQSQRMEAVGRLVGGVAHDFANLVTLISGYCEILLGRAGEKDPLRPELLEIGKAAARGAELTAQLLSYTRGNSRKPALLDLNAVIGDMQRMLRPIIGEYIEIETSLSPGLGRVAADAGQIEQVIMNLLLNARDAMPTGGRISIETAGVTLAAAEAGNLRLAAGAFVSLAVKDTGRGIDAESLPRIFEPFFTTKPEGKGTGLGLSTVQTIVSQAGGAVAVESAVGRGSVFRIFLPLAPAAAESAESRDAAPARAGDETILLVEDDQSVRQLLAHVLRRRGYRVLQASSGEEARDAFAVHSGEIQLVLTDMVMPGMSGRELAERLLSERPGLRIIFMSGYTDDVLTYTGALRPGMSFLQKPLHPDVLAAKVRETLDSPGQPFNPA